MRTNLTTPSDRRGLSHDPSSRAATSGFGSTLRRWAVALLALLIAPVGCGTTGTADPKADDPLTTQQGEQRNATSALPTDPSLKIGTLENGFRYVIKPHAKPPGRVAFYLHINSGALNETTSQNGLAHFLEHMAFNGSKNYAPGELLEEIERLGILFGPHTNAHTGQFETVYKLFLPNTTPDSVSTALTMLSDFAYGLSLLDSEIESERAVIQNEKTSRDGMMMRVSQKWINAVFEGTRYAEHNIIGTDEVIRTAPRREFKDYYDAWYRPDNMTLIVVGEVDADTIAEETRRFFGPDVFRARAESRPPRTTGVGPIAERRVFIITDPELPVALVRMMALREGRDPIRSAEDFIFNEVENLGPWILNERLSVLQNAGQAAYSGAQVGVDSLQSDALMPTATAQCVAERWQPSLEQLIREIKRMSIHGITQAEFDRAREARLTAAREASEREADRDAETVIDQLNNAIGGNYPLLSARQELSLLETMFETKGPADIAKAFEKNYESGDFSYSLYYPEREGLEIPSEEQVLAVVEEAWQQMTAPPTDEEQVAEILAELPTPRPITGRVFDSELGVATLNFENQAIVRHRKMDYEEGQVYVRITLPGGILEETPETKGCSSVANLVSATSRMTSTQLRNAMIGKRVSVQGGFREDTYNMVVQSSVEDLEVGLQLAYALLTDGRIEEAQFDNWREQTEQEIGTRDSQPGAQLQDAVYSTLFGADLRFRPLSLADLERVTPQAGEAWLRRAVAQSPMEIAVVGDIDLEQIEPLMARYIGSIPAPEAGFDRLDALRKVDRKSGPFTAHREVNSVTDQAISMVGYVGANVEDVRERRSLSMASLIITERMTRKIREELGLVYSINCSNQPAVAVPGTGFIGVQVPTKPDNVDALATAVFELMREFAGEGVSDAELSTTKLQIANLQQNAFQQPGFWLTQLSELTYRNRNLDFLKGIEEFYQSLTAEEIQATAKKYFQPEREIRIKAVPGTE